MKYIITYYSVSDQVYNQLYLLIHSKYSKDLIQPALHFLGYLINSVEVKFKRSEVLPIIPIPYTDLYKILKVSRGATEPLWKGLLELDLIEVFPEQDKVCRRFKITDKLICILHPLTITLSKTRYNLCNGRKIVKLETSQKYDDSKHKLNPLIIKFFDNVCPTIISIQTLEMGWNMFEDNKYKQIALRSCISSIINRSIELDNNHIQYTPIYKMQSTGRISEIGGGGQSCSNDFKQELFKGYYNSDLKSCQLNILRWYLEQANIEHDWLIQYVTDATFKCEVIQQSKLSDSAFKQCLLALVMGSNFNKNNAILTYIIKDIPDITDLEIQHIKALFLPLIKIISRWNSHLLTSHIRTHLVITKKGKCIRNKIDIPFYLDDYWNSKTGKWNSNLSRFLTAHLLQGFEAYFIFVLASILFDIKVSVVSQQHDGLVTKQLIPTKAIKQAQSLTGYSYGELVIKPFN